jgi:hypothetical protein
MMMPPIYNFLQHSIRVWRDIGLRIFKPCGDLEATCTTSNFLNFVHDQNEHQRHNKRDMKTLRGVKTRVA